MKGLGYAGARLGVQRALPVQLHLLQPKHGHARMRRVPRCLLGPLQDSFLALAVLGYLHAHTDACCIRGRSR